MNDFIHHAYLAWNFRGRGEHFPARYLPCKRKELVLITKSWGSPISSGDSILLHVLTHFTDSYHNLMLIDPYLLLD